MSAITLNILKPSVNNLTVRIFVRAAGLDFEEVDVWGKTGTPEFLAKDPAHLTPMIEEEGLPRGHAVGELRDHAVPLQHARPRPVLPAAPGERAMVDSAMFYLIGTLYPLVARATYAALSLPALPGRGRRLGRRRCGKAMAQQACEAAIAEPLDVYRAFFLDGKRFIGGAAPSIADIRLAATLEFLRAIDYDFPAWAEEYLAAIEESLGDAYSEPVADVRGLHRLREVAGRLRPAWSRRRRPRDMAERASCAGRGAGLASSACQRPRSSAPRQPASRPATSSRRGSSRSGPSSRRAVRSRSMISPLVFPSRRLGCTASTTLARRRALGFDARASVTAWLIGAGLEALDPDRRRIVIEGWNAYRDHGPRLVGDGGCDVRLGRAGVGAGNGRRCSTGCRSRTASWRVYEGGLFEDAPAHAIALLVRPPTIWSLAEAIDAEQLFPRGARFAPERFAAIERHAYGRIRAEHLDPAPPGRGQDRGPAAGGRAPGCERHRRRGLRARRRRRLPRASGRRPPARALRLERPRRSVHARIRALTAVNCCYCDHQLERVRSARVRLPNAFVN